MNQEASKQSYRGVRCLSCRQPIPLPGILSKWDSNLGAKDSGGAPHSARVFSLRCRVCEQEKPYRVADIVEFEGAPRAWAFRPRMRQPQGHSSGGQSKAATG